MTEDKTEIKASELIPIHRKILIDSKILPICSDCGISELGYKQIKNSKLSVHHKDNNHYNNKLKNLCWLCNHCHQRRHNGTKTFLEENKVINTELIDLYRQNKTLRYISKLTGLNKGTILYRLKILNEPRKSKIIIKNINQLSIFNISLTDLKKDMI